MKLFYKSDKYISYSKRVAKKALKRRLKKKRKLKRSRRLYFKKTDKEASAIRRYARYLHIVAPPTFSFLDNPVGVISFLEDLENLLDIRRETFVVLKNVTKVDYGAITMLLSVMFKFQVRRVGFSGDFPKDDNSRSLLVGSGFFDYIGKEVKDCAEYSIGKDNQIITHANKNVVSELSLPIMEAVSEMIWGEKKISKGLHRVLVELMQNTNNHASKTKKGEKHWWLSVNHDKDNKKASFVFMDHGVGIFSSLGNKDSSSKWYGWSDKVKSVLGLQTDEVILQLLLEGKLHATVTGEKYRGKGLPSVKQVLERNQISNLCIISNNVYANVEKGEYRLLNKVFKGAFFYWELCENNDKSIWTIQS